MVNAEFTVMPRSFFAHSSATLYLRLLQIGLYEDQEGHLLMGGGVYLHLTEDPTYETN